jgi:hypothetical protein
MTTTKKLIVLLATVLGACGADTSPIVIRGRAAPSDVDAETGACTFPPTGDFQFGPGLLDVGAGRVPRYNLPLFVRNSLAIPTAQPGQAQSEMKTWFARAARVRVRPGNAGATITVAPTAVQAGGGDAALGVDVVDATLGAALQQIAPGPGELRRVVLGITLEGETQDGESLDTEQFDYPLDLCAGCIVTPTCAAGQTLTFTSCGYLGQDAAPVCTGTTTPPPATP